MKLDENINMKNSKYSVYDMRKEIRKLYSDSSITNQLYSRLLELRDRSKNIESLNIHTNDFLIEADLKKTDDNYKDTSKILDRLSEFISNNLDKLDQDMVKSEDFSVFINPNNSLFCDVWTVGTSMKINL